MHQPNVPTHSHKKAPAEAGAVAGLTDSLNSLLLALTTGLPTVSS
ncbi:hypothetical protein SynMINOS11_01108 [Synechococcus sp. Minos11]|nr:hypothetical protein SynMINOS11_01108 [Synechococcus sp. Minos11]